jgi:hypothetical protein
VLVTAIPGEDMARITRQVLVGVTALAQATITVLRRAATALLRVRDHHRCLAATARARARAPAGLGDRARRAYRVAAGAQQPVLETSR